MAWRLARSLESLRAQVNLMAPNRSKVADGTIGDVAHASRLSDHNPDADGIVRALDLTDDPKGGLDALWLREALREGRDPRVKYVISEGQICSPRQVNQYRPWEWRPYTGPNGHFHHLHISVQPGPLGDTPGSWSLSRDFGSVVRPPIPEPEDDMTPEELIAAVRTAVHGLLKEAAAPDPTPTGKQVRDFLNAIITPSVAVGVWGAEFGSGAGRQTAAQRLALAAIPYAPVLDGEVTDQLAHDVANRIQITVKEQP